MLCDLDALRVKAEEAESDLSRATTFKELIELLTKCEAAKSLARAINAELELKNRFSVVKIRAERRLGFRIARLRLRGGSRGKSGKKRLRLVDLGIRQHQSSRWQQLASISEKEFNEYVVDAKKSGREISASAVRRLGKKKNCGHKLVDRRDATKSRRNKENGRNDNETLNVLFDEMKQQVIGMGALVDKLAESEGMKVKQLCTRYLREILEKIELAKEYQSS